MNDQHLTDIEFGSFDLPETLKQSINETGFRFCTPIQARTLPLTLKGQDVTGQARTGSGKTAAFLVSVLNRLLTVPPLKNHEAGQPRALILVPTRELAIQVHHDAEQLGRHTGLRFGIAYGGTDYEKQRKDLEAGVDVLTGTPGRIIDYFKQHVFSLRSIQAMVLDEADRMFDLGFIKDIRFLLRRLPDPENRLNMLFSATFSYRVLELAYEHMNNPQLVQVEADKVSVNHVRQKIFFPGNEEKIPLLLGLLTKLKPERAIIFANTKATTEKIHRYLSANGIGAAVLSGDVPQRKRQSLMLQFQHGDFPVLVATDVAARGLHIPDVSHVFNFDLPQDAEDYVHRIGRTARIGGQGDAISFACEVYAYSLPDIEAYIGRKIPSEAVTADLLIKPNKPEPAPRRKRDDRGGKSRPPRSQSASPATADEQQRKRRRRSPRKKSNSEQAGTRTPSTS